MHAKAREPEDAAAKKKNVINFATNARIVLADLLSRSQCANTMCVCVRADGQRCRCCEYYYCSSVRRHGHGLMGLIETKTAEREFRLTAEMRDDLNELPKQWKTYPFIRLNGSNSLTLAMPHTAFARRASSIRNVCGRRVELERMRWKAAATVVYAGIFALVLAAHNNNANLLYNILLNICTCLRRAASMSQCRLPRVHAVRVYVLVKRAEAEGCERRKWHRYLTPFASMNALRIYSIAKLFGSCHRIERAHTHEHTE